jgi:hypothetical protein
VRVGQPTPWLPRQYENALVFPDFLNEEERIVKLIRLCCLPLVLSAFFVLAVAPDAAWAILSFEVICAPDNDGDVPEVRAGDPLDVKVVFKNRRCPYNQRGFCADPSRTIHTGGQGSMGCTQFHDDPGACQIAWVDGNSGAASCFFEEEEGLCFGCGSWNNERAGLCTNTCRSELAGTATFNKLVVGLTGNANDSLGGLGIFGPFATGISGRIPAAQCEDPGRIPSIHEEIVRVVDKVPARLAGTTAVVFAQVTVVRDGMTVGESEKTREQEFCKVSVTRGPKSGRDDD